MSVMSYTSPRYTAKVVSFKVSTPQNPVLQDMDASSRLENAAKKGTIDVCRVLRSL